MRARLEAPFGHVRLTADGTGLVDVTLSPQPAETRVAEGAAALADPVRAYLDGEAARAEAAVGDVDTTAFQRRVYEALTRVPAGETTTYGELAERVGSPGAARAVGGALARNPLPLVWPCHRVTAADGLGGFGGCPPDSGADKLDVKRWLLAHEGALARALSS